MPPKPSVIATVLAAKFGLSLRMRSAGAVDSRIKIPPCAVSVGAWIRQGRLEGMRHRRRRKWWVCSVAAPIARQHFRKLEAQRAAPILAPAGEPPKILYLV